mgnify:FL=1
MKKCFLSMLTIALCAAMLACPAALAEGVTAETGQVKAAIVTEAQSGQRIFEKNAEERLNLGGLVRLPALLYALECMDSGKLAADENIVVSPEAASVGGATAFLKAGETIKAGTAMKAAVMITAGDATFALAEACAGGQDAAVKAINELMQDAGVYAEVSSIDGKGLMLSAEELAKLGARLAKSGTYKQYSALYLDEIQHENGTRTELVNQNKLIKSLDGCFAGSTGSSSEAQYCGVFMVKRKGAVFIAAVIGAADSKTRFSCASKTIEASAAAVSIKTPVKKGDKVVENVSVYGGIAKNVNLVAVEDVTLIVWNGDEPRSVINAEEAYTTPIKAGDKAGTLEYIFEISGESVSIDLAFDGDVDTAGLADYVVLCFTKWVHV